MKKYFMLIVVAILTLSGCTKEKSNEPNSMYPNVSPEASSSSPASDFTPGITIDFAKSKNDYVTDAILNILKENLKAINDKNKNKFVEGFIPGREQNNLFWIEGNKQYSFNEIASTQQEGDRINLTIYFKVKDTNTIEDNSMTYTFLKDADGTWKIALID